jgi:hypothetical protein
MFRMLKVIVTIKLQSNVSVHTCDGHSLSSNTAIIKAVPAYASLLSAAEPCFTAAVTAPVLIVFTFTGTAFIPP